MNSNDNYNYNTITYIDGHNMKTTFSNFFFNFERTCELLFASFKCAVATTMLSLPGSWYTTSISGAIRSIGNDKGQFNGKLLMENIAFAASVVCF